MHPFFKTHAGRALIILAILAGLVLLAQNTEHNGFYGESVSFDGADSYATAELAYAEPSMSARSMGAIADESIAEEVGDKVIQTGSLTLVIDDIDTQTTTIKTLATNAGGSIQNATIYEQEDGSRYGSMTLRVPADQFDATVQSLKDLALVVEYESIQADDVTERYIDLAARLNTYKAQEERYLEILQIANTVEEILDIEQALTSTRASIESLQGQLDYLDSKTDFSTIYLSLSEEPSVEFGSKRFRPATTAREAVQSLINIGQSLIEGLIELVIIGGGVALPILLIWLLVRAIKKNRS